MTHNVTTLRDDSGKGYPIDALETLIRDSENQPMWRDRADLCYAYFDGRQMTEEQRQKHLRNKLEPRTINLVGRVVRAVLGTQAKTRRDPRVEADDASFADVAEVLNQELHEARRETHAPMACSNAYSSQVVAGLGWVEVSRNSDLLGYRYRVTDVHRSEIWWDWRAKQLDLSDARWLCRRGWMDLDDITAKMPKHKNLLKQVVGDWAGVVLEDWHDERWQAAHDTDRRFGIARGEWVDGGRQRVKLYEVWYRVPVEVVVFRARGTQQWRKLDLDNPLHVAAVNRGVVEVTKTVTMEIRMALFAGPHRLIDKATTKKRFPYIPFWAFRRDEDRTPYGLVDGMIDPQDEYNEVNMRVQWMRKAQQLLIDGDALDDEYNTIQDIADSMMRPDMVAVLNANRKRNDGLVMRNDMTLQKEQYDAMHNAKELIQEIPGIYSTQMGNAPAGVTSGIAINSLVEQGILAMGDLNDNYQFAEGLVNESLMDMIIEDLSAPNTTVYVGSDSMRRPVVLNTRDANGAPLNMVVDAPVRLGLSEVPSSPAYRMQQAQQIATMITALANNAQATAILAPAYIEASDLPDRKAIADDLRRTSGLPVSGDRAGAQAWQQAQQQAAAQQAQLAAVKEQVGIEKDAATAALTNAKAQRESVLAQKDAATPIGGQADPRDAAIDEAISEARAA